MSSVVVFESPKVLVYGISNPEGLTLQIDQDQLVFLWPWGFVGSNGDYLVVPLADFCEAAILFKNQEFVEINGFRIQFDNYKVFIANDGTSLHMYQSTWEHILKELIVQGYLQTKRSMI